LPTCTECSNQYQENSCMFEALYQQSDLFQQK
jgi:hypothetical protein